MTSLKQARAFRNFKNHEVARKIFDFWKMAPRYFEFDIPVWECSLILARLESAWFFCCPRNASLASALHCRFILQMHVKRLVAGSYSFEGLVKFHCVRCEVTNWQWWQCPQTATFYHCLTFMTGRFGFESDRKKRLVWLVNHSLLLLHCAYTNVRLVQSIWYFESGNALRLAWVVTFAFQIDVKTFWHLIFLMRDPIVFVQLLNQCFCSSTNNDGGNNEAGLI